VLSNVHRLKHITAPLPSQNHTPEVSTPPLLPDQRYRRAIQNLTRDLRLTRQPEQPQGPSPELGVGKEKMGLDRPGSAADIPGRREWCDGQGQTSPPRVE